MESVTCEERKSFTVSANIIDFLMIDFFQNIRGLMLGFEAKFV